MLVDNSRYDLADFPVAGRTAAGRSCGGGQCAARPRLIRLDRSDGVMRQRIEFS